MFKLLKRQISFSTLVTFLPVKETKHNNVASHYTKQLQVY